MMEKGTKWAFVVIFVGLGAFALFALYAMKTALPNARWIKTTSNGYKIGQALLAYAEANRGEMPSGDAWRETLISQRYADEELFWSARAIEPRWENRNRSDFMFVEGWTAARLQAAGKLAADQVLLIEHPAYVHPLLTRDDDLVIVMYDGTVKTLPRQEVVNLLAAARTGDGKPVGWGKLR